MVQEAHDLVFLSIFSVRFWLLSLIFQLTVDQNALVCVSTQLHPELRVHENSVPMAEFLIFWAFIWSNEDEWKGVVSSGHDNI